MVGDGSAGRRLRLLVGGCVLAAAGCLVWAGVSLGWDGPVVLAVVFAALVAVAGYGTVAVWVRSQHGITTASGAILAAVIVLPAPWAVVVTAVGVAAAKALRRQQLVKAVFNISKETVAAAAASAAAHAVGLVPVAVSGGSVAAGWRGWLVALLAAALAYAVADEVLPVPVIATASGTRVREVAARAWRMRLAARGVDVLVAAVTVGVVVVDARLVVVVPAGLVLAHLAYTSRLRLREERHAWQQLAAAADALTAGIDADLTRVLQTAVVHAGRLFPATVAEVQHGGRLVRGGPDGVVFDGPATAAPLLPGSVIEAEPPSRADGGQQVVLRLRCLHDSRLAEREPYLLRTLAGAVDTAVSKAVAHARVSELAERSAYDAVHDPLTELPNRRHLAAQVTAMLATTHPGALVALMLLDLDHFKDVNDAIGHAAGDAVLREAASRLRAADPDALVARLGGDEFAIVFTAAEASVAAGRAEKVLGCLREPMRLDGVRVGLDASAGVALSSGGGGAIGYQELLRRADVAMYRAKGSERPLRLATYSPSHDRSHTTGLTLRAEIPRAAATSAWELAYAPVVDLASGQVAAAAAMTRWHHPDLDQLPPARCLGILQRAGQLHSFVQTLLRRALADAAHWSAHGFDLDVSVALTPQALATDLEPTISAALGGLDPRRLNIELTHTTGIAHSPAEANLANLHTAGVAIAMDGAAAAFTLATTDLPVDHLKISGGLVAAADTSIKAIALISAVAEFARRFNLPVTAEGIERLQQRRTLWELGCTHGQGPLFSRPLAAQMFLDTLAEGRISAPMHSEGAVIRLR